MDLDTTDRLLGIALTVLTISGIVGGAWWKWERPRRQRAEARGLVIDEMADVILGRAERLDRSGEVAQEAQPGVPARLDKVGTRLDSLDGRVAALTDDQEKRLTKLEHRMGAVEEAVRGCPAHTGPTPTVSASLSVTSAPEEPKA